MLEKFNSSFLKLKSTKNIATMAILIALRIALGSVSVTVAPNLRIYFTFFIACIISTIFGPISAMIAALVSDTIGFILFPSGPYFIGYPIGEMIAAFIYAIFTYDTKITIFKLGLAKFFVNLIVNVGLGSLWSHLLYGNAYIVYFTRSIIKNGLALPFEILILVIVYNIVIPILFKMNFINRKDSPLKLF